MNLNDASAKERSALYDAAHELRSALAPYAREMAKGVVAYHGWRDYSPAYSEVAAEIADLDAVIEELERFEPAPKSRQAYRRPEYAGVSRRC